MKNKTIKNSGFTLIEVLVAMSIFMIVISITVGIFVNGSGSQKKILEFNATQREAGYLMETISRELRMATAIDVSQEDNKDSSIEFTNYNGDTVEYCRSNDVGGCTDNDSGDYFSRNDSGAGNGAVINSPDIKIEHLRFYATDDFDGSEPPGDKKQPIIAISMKVKSTGSSGVELTLQNSVSLRLY